MHPSETTAFGACIVSDSAGVGFAIGSGVHIGIMVLLNAWFAYQARFVSNSPYLLKANLNLKAKYSESAKTFKALIILAGCFAAGCFSYGAGSIDPVTQLAIRLFLIIAVLFSTSWIIVGESLYKIFMTPNTIDAQIQDFTSIHSNTAESKRLEAVDQPIKGYKVSVLNVNKKAKGWQDGTLTISTDSDGLSVVFRATEEDIAAMLLISPNTKKFEAKLHQWNGDEVVQLNVCVSEDHSFLIDSFSNEKNKRILSLLSGSAKAVEQN
ncbi:hypothetical protein HDU83_004357 [Entophlyctis luteolus]|nr:hypothetical protein HDU83_004357 [Entophlyctis luteolus]KAJ3394767.1 hypothetical protein HDU84_006910 [Entophlyctis sp. JEL0112]